MIRKPPLKHPEELRSHIIYLTHFIVIVDLNQELLMLFFILPILPHLFLFSFINAIMEFEYSELMLH